ncbi:MAG: DUF4189 domain-containing protein [Rhodobacter sp.]|nr:DUF4189 domain-containing protein [Rhodobacter sp.]
MKRVLAALAFVVAWTLPDPAFAGRCGFEFCWGAVGIGPGGEWSWSTGYSEETAAVAKIRNTCPGCTEIEAFYNGCGAIARAGNGPWGFGWGETPRRAEHSAVTFCTSYGARCEAVVWSCSY